eukprot:gene4004-733_t
MLHVRTAPALFRHGTGAEMRVDDESSGESMDESMESPLLGPVAPRKFSVWVPWPKSPEQPLRCAELSALAHGNLGSPCAALSAQQVQLYMECLSDPARRRHELQCYTILCAHVEFNLSGILHQLLLCLLWCSPVTCVSLGQRLCGDCRPALYNDPHDHTYPLSNTRINHTDLFLMGACSTVNGILGSFTIPMAVFFRFVLLRRTCNWIQLVCSLVVLAGVFVALVPTLFPDTPTPTPVPTNPAPVCFMLGFAPAVVLSVLQEKTLSSDKYGQFDAKKEAQKRVHVFYFVFWCVFVFYHTVLVVQLVHDGLPLLGICHLDAGLMPGLALADWIPGFGMSQSPGMWKDKMWFSIKCVFSLPENQCITSNHSCPVATSAGPRHTFYNISSPGACCTKASDMSPAWGFWNQTSQDCLVYSAGRHTNCLGGVVVSINHGTPCTSSATIYALVFGLFFSITQLGTALLVRCSEALTFSLVQFGSFSTMYTCSQAAILPLAPEVDKAVNLRNLGPGTDCSCNTHVQEASVVVTDLKVSIDTRMEDASKVVGDLQNKVDTLAQNVHHHGAPVKPPTLSDPMAFTQPQHYAAMCLSQAEPAVLFAGARACVQQAGERGNCKRETLLAALDDFDACAEIVRPILCQLGEARASVPSVAAYTAFCNAVLRLGALVEFGRADARFLANRLGANGAGTQEGGRVTGCPGVGAHRSDLAVANLLTYWSAADGGWSDHLPQAVDAPPPILTDMDLNSLGTSSLSSRLPPSSLPLEVMVCYRSRAPATLVLQAKLLSWLQLRLSTPLSVVLDRIWFVVLYHVHTRQWALPTAITNILHLAAAVWRSPHPCGAMVRSHPRFRGFLNYLQRSSPTPMPKELPVALLPADPLHMLGPLVASPGTEPGLRRLFGLMRAAAQEPNRVALRVGDAKYLRRRHLVLSPNHLMLRLSHMKNKDMILDVKMSLADAHAAGWLPLPADPDDRVCAFPGRVGPHLAPLNLQGHDLKRLAVRAGCRPLHLRPGTTARYRWMDEDDPVAASHGDEHRALAPGTDGANSSSEPGSSSEDEEETWTALDPAAYDDPHLPAVDMVALLR